MSGGATLMCQLSEHVGLRARARARVPTDDVASSGAEVTVLSVPAPLIAVRRSPSSSSSTRRAGVARRAGTGALRHAHGTLSERAGPCRRRKGCATGWVGSARKAETAGRGSTGSRGRGALPSRCHAVDGNGLAPFSWTPWSSDEAHPRRTFEAHRAHVADGRVSSLLVVECDVVVHLVDDVVLRHRRAQAVTEFRLQC